MEGNATRDGFARRFLLVGLIAIAFALSCTSAAAAAGVTARDSMEPTLVDRINDVRAAHGLRRLRVSSLLTNAATRHAKSMGAAGYFKDALYTPSHSVMWTSYATWIDWYWPGAGYTSGAASENRAWGAADLSARAAVKRWMNSASYREKMLTRSWRHIGVAAVRVSDPLGYFGNRERVSIVVADFGRRRRPPECSDGANNDPGEDGLIDYPSDPACTGATDTTELGNPPPPSDEIDCTPDDYETDRLFSCNSAINTPIPSPAPISPDSNQIIAGINKALDTRGYSFGVHAAEPVDLPVASTPLVKVIWDRMTSPVQCRYQTLWIPMQANLLPEGDVGRRESHYTVYHEDGRWWNFFQMTAPEQAPLSGCPDDNEWHTTYYAPHPGSATDPGGGWGAGYPGLGYCVPPRFSNNCYDTTASHTSKGWGLRLYDFKYVDAGEDGVWDHALATGWPNISKAGDNPYGVSYVPPANTTDGKCYTRNGVALLPSECMPMGTRLQLDPSIDCDTVSWLVGKPEWMRVLCRTLQRYGAIVTDTGGGGGIRAEKRLIVEADGLLGWHNSQGAPREIIDNLRVIDWTRWNGVTLK